MKEFKYTINGVVYNVVVGDTNENTTEISVNGEAFVVEREKKQPVEKRKVVVKPATSNSSDNGDELQDALRSPLPGTIVEIKAKEGDVVKEGDSLIVLEAMKMDNNLTAERDGVVKKILVDEGESVKENTPLVTFE